MDRESSGCYVIDSEYNIINMNETARRTYPQLEVGKKCYSCLMGLDAPCGPCPVVNGVKGPTTYTDPIQHISEIVDAVDIEIPSRGKCHMLIFATVETEAVFAATLPTTAEELKNLALVKALTSDYLDVMSVDVKDGSMIIYRFDGKPLSANSIYSQKTSYAKGIGDYIDHYVHPDDREMMRQRTDLAWMYSQLKETEAIVLHYRVFWKNELHYFFRKIVRIGDADTFENLVIGIGCEDYTVKSQALREAMQDNLRKVERSAATGLLTKEAFFFHGDELLKQRKGQDYDFCLLRVENLSIINHQYGRLAGDKLLRLVGEILQTYELDENCIGYLGDGMFASLTPATNTEIRKRSIFGFRDKILARSEIKNIVVKWLLYKDISRELSAEEIYEKVAYSYSAARSKMHQEYVEIDQSMIDGMDWDRFVRDDFRRALGEGEFISWYQPKYSVHDRKIVGAEALVRWRRKNGEMVPPGKFIPVLENCGLINPLDEEIFRQTCVLQKKLAERGLPNLPVSVNLSRASIFTKDIAAIYSGIAQEYGVNAENIPIEITESAAVRATMIREFAASLIEKGFRLHMDDFGSGYSSLASLQVIPFESIKLDKTLVDFIGRQNGENLLKHTIAFAKESELSIVAEGVENMEQFLFLKIAGCDAIQGFYFSKPLPEDAFLKALEDAELLH